MAICRVLTSSVLIALLAVLFGLPLQALAGTTDSAVATVTIPLYLDVMLATTATGGTETGRGTLVHLGTMQFGDISPALPGGQTAAMSWGHVHIWATVSPCHIDVSTPSDTFGDAGFELWMVPDSQGPQWAKHVTEAGDYFWTFGGFGHDHISLKWQLRGLHPTIPPGYYEEIMTMTIAAGES